MRREVMDQDLPDARNPFLAMQIIAFALIQGVVVFGIVAVVMGLNREPGDPFITYIAAGFGALMIVMRLVVPPIIANSMVGRLCRETSGLNEPGQRDDERRRQLTAIYQSTMIIGMAFLEGAAFFNLVAYLSEVSPISLVVAGILLALMALAFPSRSRVETWIDDQMRMLQTLL
jgi:preprotein translocase subunit SecY